MAFIYQVTWIQVTLLCLSFIMVSSIPLIQNKRNLSNNKTSTRMTQRLSNLFNEVFNGNQQQINLKRTKRFIPTELNYSTNNRTGYLLSKSSLHFVGVFDNGTVRAAFQKSSNYSKLQFQSYNRSVVRIQSIATKLYIGMNRKGRIVGMQKMDNGTLWIEIQEHNGFSTYQSLWHLNNPSAHPPKVRKNFKTKFYLGIKNSGRTKNGKRSKMGMKSVQYLFIANQTITK